ncbi:MAG: hypothetical protein WCF20_15185 [Methylovirgula sp.]
MNGTAAQLGRNTTGDTPENPRLGTLRENLAKTIVRVARIVDLETEMLRLYRPIDFATFNHQKSHGLLELTRAIRALTPDSFDREILQDLARLREKLEKNLAVLDIHLKAVRQVSALIARAIEDDNSDGTYSASINQAVRQL